MSFYVRALDKAFAGKTVLAGVSVDLPPGEIVCLLGASGCGKSTLLRIVAGLLPADAGEVAIAPKDCAMVFQEPRLLPWLTVAENLALALPFRQGRCDKMAAITGVLQQVQLQESANLLPRELSGGMAQRVGIARALLRNARVLLMDEPFAALDAITRCRQQALLRTLIGERACLFVTHDIDEALAIASHVLVLARGEVVLREDCRACGETDKAALRVRIMSCLQPDTDFLCNDEGKP